MRPLRYSINVTVDGCCDHRAMAADEELHRHAVENLVQADALLFGRVTYEMMEAGGAGFDRRVRARGASQAGGPRADVVRGAIEACRLEAREPAGAWLGGRGDAVRAKEVAIGLASPMHGYGGRVFEGRTMSVVGKKASAAREAV